MKEWKCSVCGYIHKGDEPPESCPVCGADRSLFELISGADDAAPAAEPDLAKEPASETGKGENVKCSVCGYVHKEGQPPEACPVCGSPSDQFSAVNVPEPAAKAAPGPTAADSRWQCTVCGYIHTGPEPPETCPVCGVDRSKFILLEPEEIQPDPKPLGAVDSKSSTEDTTATVMSASQDTLTDPEPSKYTRYYTLITQLMARYHAHPIAVHIPNGVLPLAVLLLVLGVLLDSDGLLQASFYNLSFVLLAMPFVLFSGYNDWKIRFGGNMTAVFKIKMICGGIVVGLSLILVVWRLVDADVVSPWSSGRWLYVGLHVVTLAAAAVAGFYGGKLIKFPGDDKLS
jgi:rubrerythrin/uncharacterized membrane protein